MEQPPVTLEIDRKKAERIDRIGGNDKRDNCESETGWEGKVMP